MSNKIDINLKYSWFTEKGPENDVAVSTRIRLSRNLTAYPYPSVMKHEDAEAVNRELAAAFETLGKKEALELVKLDELKPVDRKILMERNLVSPDFSIQAGKSIMLGEKQRLSAMFNEIDHLRLCGFSSGLELMKVWSDLNRLDGLLEKQLDFACSMEWGYLSTELMNIGTAMRASVMLHLPALVMTGLIEKALKAVVQLGLSVKGFYGEDENSLGFMYQVSNQFTLGSSEQEVLDKLNGVVLQLVNYERLAREEMLEKQKVETEDSVYRAWGILTNARSMSAKEAMDLLTRLRMGLALGWFPGIRMETVGSLLFYIQKYHIQKVLESEENISNPQLIDYTRSRIIKAALTEEEV